MYDDYDDEADMSDEVDGEALDALRSKIRQERAAYDSALRTYRAHTAHALLLVVASLAIGFWSSGGGIGGLILSFVVFIVLALVINAIGFVINREAWRHYSDTGDRPSRSELSYLEQELDRLQALADAEADDQRRHERRYGERHQQLRAHWAEIIRDHGATCSEPNCIMPSRRIEPGAYFHLSHDHRAGGDSDYLGPSHPECNEAEARARGVVWADDERGEPAIDADSGAASSAHDQRSGGDRGPRSVPEVDDEWPF